MTEEPRKSKPVNSFKRFSRGKLLMGLGIVLVIVFWEFVWNAVKEVCSNFLPILTTPVIFEISLALMGLSFVVIWNAYHRQKEDVDEWVDLSESDSESKDNGGDRS
jgi:hypothetical protein